MALQNSIQDWGVTVSAIVAALAFVYDISSRREDKRKEETEDWKMVLLQSIFQKQKTSLDFNSIRDQYLNLSKQFQSYDLKRKDLTNDALRLCLVKMIGFRVIEQVGDDQYQIVNSSVQMLKLDGHLSEALATMKDVSSRKNDFSSIGDGLQAMFGDTLSKFSQIASVENPQIVDTDTTD